MFNVERVEPFKRFKQFYGASESQTSIEKTPG
jgi:hypothetical protein